MKIKFQFYSYRIIILVARQKSCGAAVAAVRFIYAAIGGKNEKNKAEH